MSTSDPIAQPPPEGLLQTYLSKRADLVRFFTARLGSAGAAEDLVQEIYFKIADTPDEAVQNPAAYLYRVGSNLMLDRLRQERRAARRDGDWRTTHQISAGGEDVADLPPGDEAVDSRRRLQALIAALQTLPPQQRRVFQLHKLDGLTHGQIADQLGISRSAVEKHVSAALKRLAAVLL